MSGIGRRVEALAGLVRRIESITRAERSFSPEAIALARRALDVAAPAASRFIGFQRAPEALRADLASGETLRVANALADIRTMLSVLQSRPQGTTGSFFQLGRRWQAGIGEALLEPLRRTRQRVSSAATAQGGELSRNRRPLPGLDRRAARHSSP